MQVNLHLQEILNIDIIKGTLDLKLSITMKWYDQRLKFFFINKDTRLNVIGKEEFESVWKPIIIYTNRDANPDYINVVPEMSIGLEDEDYTSVVNSSTGAITRVYNGYTNPLYWWSVIR
jgi:hypothetical protein